jgi:hypothetical protein
MRAIVKPEGELPVLETTTVGGRVLVFLDSVYRALGEDPATKPANQPITLTISQTIALTNLSPRTVTRMIARGSAERVREHDHNPSQAEHAA